MTVDDQIREKVFDRQRMRWSKITGTPGLLGRILQSVFGKNPAKGLFIVEHEAADADSLEVAGDILAAWCLDEHGLVKVEPSEVDPGKVVRRMWQYQIVRMFISDDNEHVIVNEWDGPKRGMLIQMQPRVSKGGLELKAVRAIPILGGYAVG